jgi:HAD superfamily phosphoserine phosphatase-like hydrolase
MKEYKDFSLEIWKTIQHTVENHIVDNRGPYYAAFDADGTLWDIDAGETFFEYQINHCNLKELPKDPWKHYHDWKEKDPRAAYLWLASINKGQTLEQVRIWARQCAKMQNAWPLFEPQKKLINYLKEKNVRVFIVTASVKWAVEPFADLLGLHYDDVQGVETEVVSGVVTEKQKGEITWREGKAQRILRRTQGVRPIIASGNTMGDFQLLESAELLRLAVSSVPQGHENFETESILAAEAKSKGWLSHRFT